MASGSQDNTYALSIVLHDADAYADALRMQSVLRPDLTRTKTECVFSSAQLQKVSL
jgi:hypothetical protein